MRGGSKEVPNKNLAIINNKPLLAYTIAQAIKCNIFTKIVVSTDLKKIADKSIKYGAEVFFKRPKYMAKDKSAKIPVVRHALIESEKFYKKKFHYIFDLDATSPLRTIEDLIKSFKQFKRENSKVLITASIANKNPYFNQIEYKKNKYDIVKKLKTFPKRRQDAPIVYDMNASIYIWKRKHLLDSNNLFTNKTSLYIMSQDRSCDIDTNLDLKFVKYVMKNVK